MNNRWQWIVALALIFGGLLVSPFLRAPGDAEQAMLRAQFHLPGEIAFTQTRIKRHSLKTNSYELEGVVRFSSEAFSRYQQQITAEMPWTVPALTLDGHTTAGSTGDPDARWQPFDRLQTVPFGNLNSDEFQQTTNGLAICYGIVVASAEGVPPSDGVRPCRTLGSIGEHGYVVQGVLDADTRTLFLIIRRYGEWPLIR